MSDSDKATILVVDDNPDNRLLLEDILEEDYNTLSVESGAECLKTAEQEKPDLILLDINMPEMDGYEACQALKANPETAAIPVIFVSALASTEERLKGYEVGAEEYVTKPFDEDDLLEKVRKRLSNRRADIQLEKQSADAMAAAYTAMANSAELGEIINFLRDSFNYDSYEDLGDGLVAACARFGLNACVAIETHRGREYYGCSPDSLESKVLDKFNGQDRLMYFGARCLVNGKHIALLIKNMPMNDKDKYGRIKDHIAILVDGADSCCTKLRMLKEIESERTALIRTVMTNSMEELDRVNSLIESQEEASLEVMNRLADKIESILFSLGLEEDQEKKLLALVDNSMNELKGLTENSHLISQGFNNVLMGLDSLSH